MLFHSLFWSSFLVSGHVLILSISFSLTLLQLPLGLPLDLLPWGFKSSAFFVKLLLCFLSVGPIHFYHLFPASTPTGTCSRLVQACDVFQV